MSLQAHLKSGLAMSVTRNSYLRKMRRASAISRASRLTMFLLHIPRNSIQSSTFSNRHYGLGEPFLGSDGIIDHGWAESDMTSGEDREWLHYYPEKVNRPNSQQHRTTRITWPIGLSVCARGRLRTPG
jgi:hypothetical protein